MSHAAPTPLVSRPAAPIQGAARVPGDKSISHRSLMLGALSVGETRITGLLEGEDVLATGRAMAALGAEVTRTDDGTWSVWGRGVGGLAEPSQVLDFGNAGTGVRLALGLLAGHDFASTVTGDASLCRRPMARVTTPLADMGAQFIGRSGGRLPLTVIGADRPRPLEYRLPVASAQVKSAILLCGLMAPGVTTVIEPEPTRDHSERMLRHFGAEVTVADTAEGRQVRLTGQPDLKAAPVIVPADPSSAAFLAVAAAARKGAKVTLEGVTLTPLRAGLYDCLAEMGATVTRTNAREEQGEPVADLVIEGADLTGIEVPPERAPSMIDEYPILAIAAACAEGRTVMRGLAELRVKESDRLAAVARGLAANGVAHEELEDGLIVTGAGGPPPGGGTVATEMDHRIAMSFLVLGLLAQNPVTVDDGTMIDTSFPGFAALMNGLGADMAPA